MHCLSWFRTGTNKTKLDTAPDFKSQVDTRPGQTSREDIQRWSDQHGVGIERALHLERNRLRDRTMQQQVEYTEQDREIYYMEERQCLVSTVVELALGSCNQEADDGSPQIQKSFLQTNSKELLVSLLQAFSATQNAAQWWDGWSHAPAPAAAQGGGLLGGGAAPGGLLAGQVGANQAAAAAGDEPRAMQQRVEYTLQEMTLHLQAILSIFRFDQIATVMMQPIDMKAFGVFDQETDNDGSGSSKPILIVMIRVLHQTLWGSGRPSLARLLPADNPSLQAIATRIRQLAALTVALALESVDSSDFDLVNKEIERLTGGSADTANYHGVVRMAWALQCAKSHYIMPDHTGPDCVKVWKFVTDHWSAAEQMHALPAVRDMCTHQGVASLHSHDENFVEMTVQYKVTDCLSQ